MFSIVVPIYNVEPYLEKCVTSLRNQTWEDIEIILVDDESPDHCPALCDAFAAEDPRIKVIHRKNGGLSEARNSGLKVAEKEYVIFVDADDYIEEDTCERFAGVIRDRVDVVIGEAIVHGGECPLGHIEAAEEICSGIAYLKKAHQAGRAPMAAWLNVYRREFLLEKNLRFKPSILHEDEQFTPRAFLKAERVLNSGIPFYHYILREGSITTRKDKRRNAADLYDTCCELETMYRALEDLELRQMLLDSLVTKYLNMFQVGRLYRYGRTYIHMDFLRRNAQKTRTKLKVLLMGISPRLYYFINKCSKKIRFN